MLENIRFRQVVRSNGIQLRVASAGAGPLVVFVHGFPETWMCWRHQLGAIAAAGYEVAAIQTRGYGESSKPAAVAAYTIVEMADDIAAVIEAFGAAKAILIGHDWGGAQVYGTALVHPAKVKAIVGLAYTAGAFVDRKMSEIWGEFYPQPGFYQNYFRVPGEIEAQLQADVGGFLRKFMFALSGDRPDSVNGLVRPAGTARLLDGLPDPEPLPPWLDAPTLEYAIKSFTRGGFRGPINRYRAQDLDVDQLRPFADHRINQPTMWIGGGRDPARYVIPGVDRYADPLSRCTDQRGAFILPGVGHWMQQEAPGAVNDLILEFLAKLR